MARLTINDPAFVKEAHSVVMATAGLSLVLWFALDWTAPTTHPDVLGQASCLLYGTFALLSVCRGVRSVGRTVFLRRSVGWALVLGIVLLLLATVLAPKPVVMICPF